MAEPTDTTPADVVAGSWNGPVEEIEFGDQTLLTEHELRLPDGSAREVKATRARALELRDAEPGAKLYSRHARRSTVTSFGAWAEVVG